MRINRLPPDDFLLSLFGLQYISHFLFLFLFDHFPFLRVSSSFNTLDLCLTNQWRLPRSSEGLVALTFDLSAGDRDWDTQL